MASRRSSRRLFSALSSGEYRRSGRSMNAGPFVGEGSGLWDHPCRRLSPALRYWRKQGILELDVARRRSWDGERGKLDRGAAGRVGCRNERDRCFTRHTGCALPDAPADRKETWHEGLSSDFSSRAGFTNSQFPADCPLTPATRCSM